jgi:molybdenum cofactor guanylyltransferase
LAVWIQSRFLNSPILTGLILAGGKSVRMGEDKSQIEYHGIPQWQYLSMCMEDLGVGVNISCRSDQQEKFSRKGVNLILDKVVDFGPMGGLISAFMNDSSKAYLTIASDLPNVNSAFLLELINHRDPSAFATAFINNEKGWPEPLITIWEPRSFLRIMQFVGVGITCPRKVLMNTPIKLVEPSDQGFLLNVNNPEERDKVLFGK